MQIETRRPRSTHVGRRLHLLMWGVLCVCIACCMYLAGVVLALPRYLFQSSLFTGIVEWLVWYSGAPLVLGVGLASLDLFVLFNRKRSQHTDVRCDPVPPQRMVVALTAYNDEASIAAAVADFRASPLVDEVIVISNNSVDRTVENALAAGATTLDEPKQGYGRCVYRCLEEAIAHGSELIVLCEGDRTFRAYDLEKLAAYIAHADIVNGTRTVERLRARDTQLSTFMYYGNLFVGKILEAKHLGRSTITDVGATFKLCRRSALVRLMPHLDPSVNLEFNAHFIDTALSRGLDVVECPITFHPRVGVSKGGNVNDARALRVGLRMLTGIVFRWRAVAS